VGAPPNFETVTQRVFLAVIGLLASLGRRRTRDGAPLGSRSTDRPPPAADDSGLDRRRQPLRVAGYLALTDHTPLVSFVSWSV